MNGTPGARVYDTKETATAAYDNAIAMFGHMRADPKGTMAILLDVHKKGK